MIVQPEIASKSLSRRNHPLWLIFYTIILEVILYQYVVVSKMA